MSFVIMQCSGPECSIFLRLCSVVGQNLAFFAIVQFSRPEYSILLRLCCVVGQNLACSCDCAV